MKQCIKVPFGQICSIWMCAKWVPKLSEKSRNFDKKASQIRASQIRVSQIRVWQIRASQIRASQIRASEISSNHRELQGAIFSCHFRNGWEATAEKLVQFASEVQKSGYRKLLEINTKMTRSSLHTLCLWSILSYFQIFLPQNTPYPLQQNQMHKSHPAPNPKVLQAASYDHFPELHSWVPGCASKTEPTTKKKSHLSESWLSCSFFSAFPSVYWSRASWIPVHVGDCDLRPGML